MGIKPYRNAEFLESDDARDIRILSDYSLPNSILNKQKVKDTVVMFGSARILPPEKGQKKMQDLLSYNAPEKEIAKIKKLMKLSSYYTDAVELAKKITLWGKEIAATDDTDEKRLLVCTGGGPGIMEAGNRGAKEAGGKSIALNISLPSEQEPNPFVDPDLNFEFNYFFIRKLWFVHLAKAIVVFPGGYGTADELFETLTLIQTKKVRDSVPVLLYGSDFWKGLVNFDLFVEYSLISEEDLDIFQFVDTPDQAMSILKEKIIL